GVTARAEAEATVGGDLPGLKPRLGLGVTYPG
ncbi:MAG: hypothetical protein RIT02_728, partial [Planctomycetota bacterium]